MSSVEPEKGPLIVLGRIGGRRFAWPVAIVDRVLPMAAVTPAADLPPGVVGFLDVHGEILMVVDPRERLGLAAQAPLPEQHLLQMSASADGERYLLWVDHVEDIVSVDACDLEAEKPADELGSKFPHMVSVDGELVRVLAASGFGPRRPHEHL